ncbi:DMT family transporter [Sagittula sp. SSi028]|uniref:DMT family transporter n=1 Tax=Sagittula sp. SSi028 TaxID=3400636 RepID=UPI003AF8355C
MKLFGLVVVIMVAFAANSVLNRAGVGGGQISPVAFGVIRLLAGAVTLAVLCGVLRGGLRFGGAGRLAGVAGLLIYIFGFSFAYVGLESGLGALILFGMVQVTMFAGSVMGGERPAPLRWIGAAVAFCGLAWLVWPQDGVSAGLLPSMFMLAAGFGWGVYSLAGKLSSDALQATAANFVLATPIAVVVLLGNGLGPMTFEGVALAIVSGAVTSGLGYALWYAVLPRLDGSVAAVAQLTVPVIAMAGGMLFLTEPLTMDFVIASALVLGGVALSVLGPRFFGGPR